MCHDWKHRLFIEFDVVLEGKLKEGEGGVFYIDLLELVEFEFAEALLKFVEVNLKLMKIPVDLGDFVQLDIIKYFSFVFHFSSH